MELPEKMRWHPCLGENESELEMQRIAGKFVHFSFSFPSSFSFHAGCKFGTNMKRGRGEKNGALSRKKALMDILEKMWDPLPYFLSQEGAARLRRETFPFYSFLLALKIKVFSLHADKFVQICEKEPVFRPLNLIVTSCDFAPNWIANSCLPHKYLIIWEMAQLGLY